MEYKTTLKKSRVCGKCYTKKAKKPSSQWQPSLPQLIKKIDRG
jgi:hypothetical protein